MPRFLILVLVAATLVSAGCSAEISNDQTSGERLKQHVTFLANDSLGGRLVGTPGIELAATYITDHLISAGIEPLFGDSYRQEFEIELGRETAQEPRLVIAERELAYEDEFGVIPASGSGEVEGSIVISSGIPPDDADLSGKILFAVVDPETEAQRWTVVGRDGLLEWMKDVAAKAHGRGAVGVVFVGTTEEPCHYFPIQRRYDVSDLCLVETSRTIVENILGSISGIKAGEARQYPDRRCHIAVEMTTRKVPVANIGGLIRGRTERYLVIGAHYDHLGYGEIASSTPWRREVHNGADDNASGVAVLLEVARALAAMPQPDRSIALVSFTAEELGAVGSEYFVKNPPFPIDSLVAMINLDTVGRLENGRLIVFGARSAEEFSGILDEIDERYPCELIKKREIFGFSDQNPFYARGIPSLHIFTGAYSDYHSPDDDWVNLNFDGMVVITSIVVDLASKIASSGIEVTPVIVAEEPKPQRSGGRGAFLGIVPDFTYAGTGVGIKGTIPDSPAEAAGLQSGDVIVSIDGKPIADLKGLMYVLVSKEPGDEIEIKIMRSSQSIVKRAVLGVRSQRK